MVKYEPLFKLTTNYPPGTSHAHLPHPYYMHRDSISLSTFNDHRFAFYFWALWNDKRELNSVDLVSLDWHQDLVYPEDVQKEELKVLDVKNTFETSFFSWARLSSLNDDHIVAAMYKNIIGNAYIVCKQDMNRRNDDESIIDMYGNTHIIKKFESTDEAYHFLNNTSIEQVYFDIDLDFFTKANRSTNSKQQTTYIKESDIKNIVNIQSDFMWWVMQRIQGFTIALEPDFTGGFTKAIRLFGIIEKALFTGSIFRNATTWRHF